MECLAAVRGWESTSISTIFVLLLVELEISTSVVVIIWQGTAQLAQKCTTTGSVALKTSFSKFVSQNSSSSLSLRHGSGSPQLGQDAALGETSFPHHLHGMSDPYDQMLSA